MFSMGVGLFPEAGHAEIVPDELVDLFALAGNPEECEQRLREISKLGIDQVAIVPFVEPGESREQTIRTFAEICRAIEADHS